MGTHGQLHGAFPLRPMPSRFYGDDYLQRLFDRLGPTHAPVNFISSFGFCTVWRSRCVRDVWSDGRNLDTVRDLMAGPEELQNFHIRSAMKWSAAELAPGTSTISSLR